MDAGSKKKDGKPAALKYAGSITTTATFEKRCADVVSEEQFASDVQKAAGEDADESVAEKSGDENSCFVLCKTKGVAAEDSKNVAKAIRESFSATRRRLNSHMVGAEVSGTVTKPLMTLMLVMVMMTRKMAKERSVKALVQGPYVPLHSSLRLQHFKCSHKEKLKDFRI